MSDPFVNVRNVPDHSAVPSRQDLTQSDGCTKVSNALPDSRAVIPIFGQSLLTIPDRTRAVTYQDRSAHLRLTLHGPNLVFKSPVRFGFFPFLRKTETESVLVVLRLGMQLDRTH